MSTLKFSRVLITSLALVGATLYTSRAEAQSLPFKAVFTGTFSVTNQLVFSGEGQASHLGHSTINGTTISAPLGQASCPDGYIFFQIEIDFTVVTAANGDSLVMHNSGGDCINFVTGDITGTGTYNISGGTGRFVNATGTGAWHVAASLISSEFVLDFAGGISY